MIKEQLDSLVLNLQKFFPCKFKSTDGHWYCTGRMFFYDSFSSKKELYLGFDGAYRFFLGRDGKNTFRKIHVGTPIVITSLGIRFTERPDIVTRPGPASIVYEEDKTIDVYCADYSSSDAYFNLSIKYPTMDEHLLRIVEYFCVNPVPTGTYLEMDCSNLEFLVYGTEGLQDKIQCK